MYCLPSWHRVGCEDSHSFSRYGLSLPETYAYRDRIASEWQLNLINLLPRILLRTRGRARLLYQSAPDACCKLRKLSRSSKPLPAIGVDYGHAPRTGKEPDRSRRVGAVHASGGRQVLKLAPLAAWTTRDVWYACEVLSIPLLRSMSAATLPSVANRARRSIDPTIPLRALAGRKVECGIHIEAARLDKKGTRN